jgi:hypothetical protein
LGGKPPRAISRKSGAALTFDWFEAIVYYSFRALGVGIDERKFTGLQD